MSDVLATEAAAQRKEVAAIQGRGRLVMLCYPHQLSLFVRANLAKGLMPAAGPAELFIGIDVDVMNGFAEQLGVTLEVRRASKPRFAAELVVPAKDSLKIAFRIPEVEHYGIAVRPGSDLLAAVNQYLDKLKISGELQKIIRRHSN